MSALSRFLLRKSNSIVFSSYLTAALTSPTGISQRVEYGGLRCFSRDFDLSALRNGSNFDALGEQAFRNKKFLPSVFVSERFGRLRWFSEECTPSDSETVTPEVGSHELPPDLILHISEVFREHHGLSDDAAEIDESNIKLQAAEVCEVLSAVTNLNSAFTFFKWARANPNCEVDFLAYDKMYQLLKEGTNPCEMQWLLVEMHKQGLDVSEEMVIGLLKTFQNKEVEAALHVFERLEDLGCKPSTALFNCIMDIAAKAGHQLKVYVLYSQMQRVGCVPDCRTIDILMERLCKAGRSEEAYKIFQQAVNRGPVLATTVSNVFGCLIKAGKGHIVYETFNRMKGKIPVDSKIYALLINYLADSNLMNDANALYQEMMSLGIPPLPSMCINLISRFVKAGNVNTACILFMNLTDQKFIGKSATECIVWNVYQMEKTDMAWSFLKELGSKGHHPDPEIHYYLIKCFAQAERLDLVKKVLQSFVDSGHSPLVDTYNLVIGLAGRTNIDAAKELFSLMKQRGCEPDTGTYNALIDVLYNGGLIANAFELFYEMTEKELHCNWTTYQLLLKILAAPEYARTDVIAASLSRLADKGKFQEAGTYLSDLSDEGLLEKTLAEKISPKALAEMYSAKGGRILLYRTGRRRPKEMISIEELDDKDVDEILIEKPKKVAKE